MPRSQAGRLFDHVHLRVSDLETSRRFYEPRSPSLGHELRCGESYFAFDELYVTSDGKPTSGLHLAFQAPDRETVDRFFDAAHGGGRQKQRPSRRARLSPGLLRLLRPRPRRQQHRGRLPRRGAPVGAVRRPLAGTRARSRSALANAPLRRAPAPVASRRFCCSARTGAGGCHASVGAATRLGRGREDASCRRSSGRLGTRPWLLRRARWRRATRSRRRSRPSSSSRWPIRSGPRRHTAAGSAGTSSTALRLADERRPRAALHATSTRSSASTCPSSARRGRGRAGFPRSARWVEGEVERLGHVVLGDRAGQALEHLVRAAGRDRRARASTSRCRSGCRCSSRRRSVTERLARRFPGYAPVPLAVDPERGWMLLPAFEELFDDDVSLDVWQDALRRFAGLQLRTSRGHCGAPRRRVPRPSARRAREPDRAAAERPGSRPPPGRRQGRRAPPPGAGARGDLRPARRRAASRRRSCTATCTSATSPASTASSLYFDWTDACVAHPFIDLLSLQWQPDEAKRAGAARRVPGALARGGALGAAARGRRPRRRRDPAPSRRLLRDHRREPGAVGKGRADATHEFLREVLAEGDGSGRRVESRPCRSTS